MANMWTEEQWSAITTRNRNLLVAAAAGSGKTAVLVERIIKMITDKENPIDIDKLLVVTFTNAAASEMRERIGDAITREIDKNPESKVLQRQLTLLNKASITTIHSFCLDVIKNNFHCIDLDPGFRIADSTECILLKQEALEEVFEDNYKHLDFQNLVECYGGSKDDLQLQETVLSLYSFVMSGPWPKRWLLDMAEEFNVPDDYDIGESKWGEVIKNDIKIELSGFKLMMEKAIGMITASEGLESYIDSFSSELFHIERILECCSRSWNDMYDGFYSISFGTLKRCGKDCDKDVQERVKAIRDTVKKGISKIKDEIFNLTPEASVKNLQQIYPCMKSLSNLVMEFDEAYSTKKRDKGLLDFNDLEHFCLNILTSTDDDGNICPSEVALKLRSHFEEILVDEYQDSNNVQEVILSMISRTEPEVPNRFMVGDVKQSIYRFRQADPTLFLEKYNTYDDDDSSQGRRIMLYKNFRSREEVISGVNYIFKYIMSENVGELNYTDKEALNLGAMFKDLDSGDNQEEKLVCGGPIEVHLIEKGAKELEGGDEETAEDDTELNNGKPQSEPEEDLSSIQLEARVVAKRIKDLFLQQEGKRLVVFDKNINGYRPVQYRDIVILMRATSNWAPVFCEELGAAGIPSFADMGTGYFDNIEVQTILSLLQIIDNPLQDIPLLAVLRSPIFYFTPEELIDIRLADDGITFYEAIKMVYNGQVAVEESLRKKVSQFLAKLDEWRDKSTYMPIDELIWLLYNDTGYYAYIAAMPCGGQKQANLRILFERARQFEKTSYKGLFNFISFINKLKISDGDMGSAKILGENENVVRIMSIHKSKGLEFPIVIVSGTGKNFNMMDMTRSILYHQKLGYGPNYVDHKRRISYATIAKNALKKKIRLESLSEEMRILYVAFTRAKEKLIITGLVKDIEKACSRWCENIDSCEARIPEYLVMKGKSYLDWIGTVLVKHRDNEEFRKIAGMNDSNPEVLIEDKSLWKLRCWSVKDITESKDKEELSLKANSFEALMNDQNDKYYSSCCEEINRRLSWQYPFKSASLLPTKLSVSELKRLSNLEVSDEYTTRMFSSSNLTKQPAFLEETKELTASQKGTAMHSVMQHIDLSKSLNYNNIKQQLESMVINELITIEQAKSINISKILAFFKSELGRRMLKSGKVFREVPFYIDFKSTHIYKDLPASKYDNEVILVQGIIDCYFEDDEGLVLLDYKTDYANDENMGEIKYKYEAQIEYYAEALKRMTGRKVKERYIYLFGNGQIINYE